MTDENMSLDAEQTEHVEVEIDYKSKYEEAQKAIDALASKRDELLNETKKAKEEKRRQTEEARTASEKNGEYEKLWKAAEEEKEKYRNELHQSHKERRDEKINLAAMRLAGELAKGDANKAELLSDFLAKTISNVADDYGNIENDVLMGVKSQFENDKKYAPLLGGNLSNGSGATGNSRGAGSGIKEMTMAELSKLSPQQKLDFSLLYKAGKAKLI